jgi:hypothetical protein
MFAAAVALSACATSGEVASTAPSQLSVAEINAEIAAISAEASALYRGEVRGPVPAIADHRPMRLTYVDSTGAVMSNYLPGDTDRYSYRSFSSSSRPYFYARIEALAKRRADLHAELRHRGVSQQ